MTSVNPIRDQLSHITVDYDAQGRLILDNQGQKYEITLESNDGQGHTTQLTLQRNGASTNAIKALIAGLFQAHVVHDHETANVQRMDRQGLQYADGALKNHDFVIWDQNPQDPNRAAATMELVDKLAPNLEGTWVRDLVKTQDVWNRLEALISTPGVAAPSQTTTTTNPTQLPLQPETTEEPTLDPMRRINKPMLSAEFRPSSTFEADDEVEADLTLDDVAPSSPSSPHFSPLPPVHPKKHADFVPSVANNNVRTKAKVTDAREHFINWNVPDHLQDKYSLSSSHRKIKPHRYSPLSEKYKRDHSALLEARKRFAKKLAPPQTNLAISFQQQQKNQSK